MGIAECNGRPLARTTHVYQVYYQSDMTEGRGRMLAGMCFTTEELAWGYCDMQQGVMGRKPNGSWKDSQMGDWDVRPIKVYNKLPVNKKEVALKAMAILTEALSEEELNTFLEMTRK